MKNKILRSIGLIAVLSASLFSSTVQTTEIEKVYDSTGVLLVPTYPIMDKRNLSKSRGGDVDDYKSTVDGLGVSIVSQKGESVMRAYGVYNSMLRKNAKPNVTIDDMIGSGQISSDRLAKVNDICVDPDYTCADGLRKNLQSQRCEAIVSCADASMIFDGAECKKDTTSLIPSSLNYTYSCISGELVSTNCKIVTRSTTAARNTSYYSCSGHGKYNRLTGSTCYYVEQGDTYSQPASYVRRYACGSGWSLSGSTCFKTLTNYNAADATPVYSCSQGILNPDNANCTIGVIETAPAQCAKGLFSSIEGKCIDPLIRTCK